MLGDSEKRLHKATCTHEWRMMSKLVPFDLLPKSKEEPLKPDAEVDIPV